MQEQLSVVQKHLLIVTVLTAAVAGKRKNYSIIISNEPIGEPNLEKRISFTAEVTMTYITET
jgi:hypothetical protein